MTTSLHELFASNTKPRTRFVEHFSGDALDTLRWDTTLVNNGTVAMSDTSNGGLILSTGTSSGTSSAQIDFGDIKQFGGGSSIIWTSIHSHSATGESYSGLTAGSTQGSGAQGIYRYVNTCLLYTSPRPRDRG